MEGRSTACEGGSTPYNARWARTPLSAGTGYLQRPPEVAFRAALTAPTLRVVGWRALEACLGGAVFAAGRLTTLVRGAVAFLGAAARTILRVDVLASGFLNG